MYIIIAIELGLWRILVRLDRIYRLCVLESGGRLIIIGGVRAAWRGEDSAGKVPVLEN